MLYFFALILFLWSYSKTYLMERQTGGAVWSEVALFTHYENTPIQIYWKIHLQKLKIYR